MTQYPNEFTGTELGQRSNEVESGVSKINSAVLTWWPEVEALEDGELPDMARVTNMRRDTVLQFKPNVREYPSLLSTIVLDTKAPSAMSLVSNTTLNALICANIGFPAFNGATKQVVSLDTGSAKGEQTKVDVLSGSVYAEKKAGATKSLTVSNSTK